MSTPKIPSGPLQPPKPAKNGVGQSDLDPLGRLGKGNTLDARGSKNPKEPLPGLPQGSVVPGARFDHYGPPNPAKPDSGSANFGVPQPDHEKPPT